MANFNDNNGILENSLDPKCTPDPRGYGAVAFYKMKENSDRIAQIDVETNKSETYGELLSKSIRVALKMKQLGVKENDISSLCTVTHAEACIPYWASLFMGVRPANLDPSLSISDFEHLMNLVKPKIIFSIPDSVQTLENVINKLNLNTKLVVFGETDKHTSFEDCLKAQEGEETFQPRIADNLFDTVAVLFSSGTTGLSKGICITHYGLLYNINVLRDYINYERSIFYSSPYWISYVIISGGIVMSGGCRIICRTFDEKTVLKTIQDYKVTFFFLSPPFTYALTSHYQGNNNFDISSLSYALIGGGGIGKEQTIKLKKLFPNTTIAQMYGSTESVGLIAVFHYKDHAHLAESKLISCGKMVSDTKCKVVDVESNTIVGPNKPGELRMKSKRLMTQYYNNPEKTKEVFDEEGYLCTGDIVYYDDDYCFFVVDRIKELLKYKTWHVVPAELEDILIKHPAIKEVVVIGYPDEIDGDHPMAVIIPHENAKVTENDILTYFNDQVIDRKKLRGGVRFVNDIPKTATGKYNRRVVKTKILNNEVF